MIPWVIEGHSYISRGMLASTSTWPLFFSVDFLGDLGGGTRGGEGGVEMAQTTVVWCTLEAPTS